MKERTKNALIEIQTLTQSKCETCSCSDKYRCCDKVFCSLVKQGLKRAGVAIDQTDNVDIPYMGARGCVVPPEYRPGCSGYVCPDHFRDRKFKRQWERLHKRFATDPDVLLMMPSPCEVIRSALKEST